MPNRLVLLRGLPGAGKTTLAESIQALTPTDCCFGPGNCAMYAADDFFIDSNGEYKFDASMLGAAHANCKQKTEWAMQNQTSLILVHNTFTTEREMKPYFDLAEKHGYEVSTLIVENRHGNESVHDVPAETILRMNDRFHIQLY